MAATDKKLDSVSVEELLRLLVQLQSTGNSIYPKGIFPSQRCHPFLPYRREDDNLFFTASIAHMLQLAAQHFTDVEKALSAEIMIRAKGAYQLFKNKDGLDTYNFWQTRPSRHFPNGMFMHRFKHFQIPDDVDDTALVFLTENANKDRVAALREKLKQHANLAYKQATNPLPKYRHLKCYSTFFGKKMYIEFDVCVLSNLMRLILTHFSENELNEYDMDTLRFISEVIENNEHSSLPFYSAPNYPTTELIIYHTARMVPLLPEAFRTGIERKLKQDIQERISNATCMNRILLENAAMKLGLSIEPRDGNLEDALNDPKFFFFHAGMITAFENPLAQSMASNTFFHLRYASKALNGALLIENYVLKRGLLA